MSKKYLFLQRSQPGNRQQPSPAQMQDMYAAFNAWKEKFKDNILDMGGKLMPAGKVVIPRRGRHRRRALFCAFVRTDALAGNRGSLCDVGTNRCIAAPYDEPRGGRRGMEGPDAGLAVLKAL